MKLRNERNHLLIDYVNKFRFNIYKEQARYKLPFEVSLDIPNAETLAAIDDVNHRRNLSKTFHSIAELMEDLNA